jgi:hypothetical protein
VNGERLDVTVTIMNDQTGHHVPTDSPLRHLILLVDAADSNGTPLTQLSGSTLPDWCGLEDSFQFGGGDSSLIDRDYAGLPGKSYAKVLMELWTEITPSGAYWNPTQIVSDNRIPAFGKDRTQYSFALSELEDNRVVKIQVKLLFRRAFLNLIQQKGWDSPDIVMESKVLVIEY